MANKKKMIKVFVLILLLLTLFTSILAETQEEERIRLENELSNLSQQLIDSCYSELVNETLTVKSVFAEDYSCNETGYYTVDGYCNIFRGENRNAY